MKSTHSPLLSISCRVGDQRRQAVSKAPEGSKEISGGPGQLLRKVEFEQILEDDKQALRGHVSGAGNAGSGSEGLLA